jgi:MYXO-CTERM domain-containing protein
MKPRHATWIFVALAALAQGPAVGAFSRTGGVWRTLPVTWYWNPATVPASLGGPDNGRMALEAGFATWSSAPCTSFRATNAGTTMTVRGSTRDRVNTLAWISGSWPAELGAVNTVIGVTLPVSSGGANIDADIMYNAVGFTWSLDGRRGTVDAQSIAVHEEGHFLGLGHTTSPRESIMYPSYPGRPSRVMSSDDINGVCTLYPGTGPRPDAGVTPPFDAGTPTDPCNAITSCGECTPQATCGWCSSTRRCMTGVVAGPTVGSCPSGWAPFPMNCTTTPPVDSGTVTRDTGVADPCAGYGSCGTCAAANGCGWCGAAGRCMYATMASGPARETCAGDWAIEPSVCPGGGGTTMFGGPCRSGADCSSGGPCVGISGRTPFCSQRCEDDCNCPRGYTCLMASATLSVCIPGNNVCTPAPVDAGGPAPLDVPRVADVPAPPVDLGASPDDAGSSTPDVASNDAEPADGGTIGGGAVDEPGCGCRAGGAPERPLTGVVTLVVGVAALLRRRRRHAAAR